MREYRLTDICDFQGGSQPPKKDWLITPTENSIRMLQIRDFTQAREDKKEHVKLSKSLKLCKNDDILIARYGASVGKILTGLSGAYNVAIMKTIPNETIIIKPFLGYYLKSNFFQHFIKNVGNRAAQAGFNKEDLNNLKIKLPSIEEQQRIVKILDKAEEIRIKKKLANEKLDEFIDATFYDRFGNPEANEHSWDIVKLENVCNKITDGVHSKPVYTNIGIPFISVKDITTKKLLFEDCKFISEDDHYKYIKRCNPEYNDILYTKVGATYGRAAIVDTTKPFSLYVSVALLKPKKELINPLFLKAVLNTKYVKTQADKRIKGIGVPDLHLIEIKNFAIPLPPFEQQNQFAQIVHKVEAQKEKNQKVIEQMDNLFNSLMQQAFNDSL